MSEHELNGVAVVAADLSAAMPLQESVLYIVVPGTNKRTGWEITFAGPGHPKTIAQNEDAARRQIDKEERIEQTQVNMRKWKTEGEQVIDRRRKNVDWVVGRIITWTPVKISKDAPGLEFSEKAAMELLLRYEMTPYFIQMTDFLGEQASFIAASAKT